MTRVLHVVFVLSVSWTALRAVYYFYFLFQGRYVLCVVFNFYFLFQGQRYVLYGISTFCFRDGTPCCILFLFSVSGTVPRAVGYF
jgi:hypothetical protein